MLFLPEPETEVNHTLWLRLLIFINYLMPEAFRLLSFPHRHLKRSQPTICFALLLPDPSCSVVSKCYLGIRGELMVGQTGNCFLELALRKCQQKVAGRFQLLMKF